MGDKIMLYFLASIPRSGSTLLASLLGQRKDTYVSQTSNLGDILGSVVKEFGQSNATKACGHTDQQLYTILKSITESQYSDRSESVIFDKGRIWPTPQIIETMEKSIGDVKIVATVRPIAECIASLYTIENKQLPIKHWVRESYLMDHLMFAYNALKEGYEKYLVIFLKYLIFIIVMKIPKYILGFIPKDIRSKLEEIKKDFYTDPIGCMKRYTDIIQNT